MWAAAKKYWLHFICAVIVIYSVVIFGLYFSNFRGPTSDLLQDWGVTGDYFGGFLNPIISLGTLILVFVTYQLNREELRATRISVADQAKTLELQRFESTFFSILEQHNKTLEHITSNNVSYSYQGVPSNEGSIASALVRKVSRSVYVNDPNLDALKIYFLTLSHEANAYFRLLYQLLKFIAANCPDSATKNMSDTGSFCKTATIKEKTYSNIIRSSMSEEIYWLLAINCAASDSNTQFYKFKLLIERYALLEHLNAERVNMQGKALMETVYSNYAAAAFGDNDGYKLHVKRSAK